MGEAIRRFFLQRDDDQTGVSGTGVIAHGVQFDDGTVVLHWLINANSRATGTSVAIWDSVDDMLSVHGHDGRTYPMWLDHA